MPRVIALFEPVANATDRRLAERSGARNARHNASAGALRGRRRRIRARPARTKAVERPVATEGDTKVSSLVGLRLLGETANRTGCLLAIRQPCRGRESGLPARIAAGWPAGGGDACRWRGVRGRHGRAAQPARPVRGRGVAGPISVHLRSAILGWLLPSASAVPLRRGSFSRNLGQRIRARKRSRLAGRLTNTSGARRWLRGRLGLPAPTLVVSNDDFLAIKSDCWQANPCFEVGEALDSEPSRSFSPDVATCGL
jgi:hypothetical protein